MRDSDLAELEEAIGLLHQGTLGAVDVISARLTTIELAIQQIAVAIYGPEPERPEPEWEGGNVPTDDVDRGEPHEDDRQGPPSVERLRELHEDANFMMPDYEGPANGLDENGVQ